MPLGTPGATNMMRVAFVGFAHGRGGVRAKAANGESGIFSRYSLSSPRIAQCSRTRISLRAVGELAVEFGKQGQRGVMNNSAPAEVSAEIVRDRRAVNGELAPGSVSNAALRAGLLTKSCARQRGRAK